MDSIDKLSSEDYNSFYCSKYWHLVIHNILSSIQISLFTQVLIKYIRGLQNNILQYLCSGCKVRVHNKCR